MTVDRVLVQGGGLGGLTLATGLAQRGVEVDVVELRADPVLGVGLSVPSNALGALAEIGVRDAVVAAGWPYEALHLWDPAGHVVARIPPPASGYGLPSNVAVPRRAYGRILREAAEAAGARIRTGVTTTQVVQDRDGVDVRIGETDERYDLVVGFDGIRSTLRAHVGDAGPEFTGYAVWRATTKRHPLVDRIVMSMASSVKAVLTPMTEDTMYMAVVTAEPGNPRQDPDQLVALLQERMAVFTGPVAELRDGLDHTSTVVYTPLEQVTVPGPWYRGRIAIGGDAAHASTPHLAQGGAMAVEDAVVLTAALTGGQLLPEALESWYRRRRPRAAFVQDMSLALLHQESGSPTTDAEAALLALGIPGAARRLAEPY